MKRTALHTAERVSAIDPSDNYIFQRSILAYHEAAQLVSGTVLEIGTGSGYGLELISPRTHRFYTIDKTRCIEEEQLPDNTLFIQMSVPRLCGFPNESVDFVLIFQVIEHIEEDECLIREINRVLKKGGKLLLTTPNKNRSLTRNPWHIREYSIAELENLLRPQFTKIEMKGVFGNERVWSYYQKNKAAIHQLTRFDFLNLQYRLPRFLLQFPYDILNRMNRRSLLKKHFDEVTGIRMEDYFVREADENCFDLFYIAEKS